MTTITIERELLDRVHRYLNDRRLFENECDRRKRNETNQEHSDRISSAMQRNEDLREFIQEVESALAAPATAPAWHEAPTVPGVWICDEGDICYTWTAHNIEILDQFDPGDGLRWYGPIPEDRQ